MEILVIGVFIGVIWFTFRSRPSKGSKKPSAPTPGAQPHSASARPAPMPRSQPSPAIPPVEKTATTTPPGFDEESARHLDETRVLTGSAYITDGDTIKIKATQIRLFGVDAPELNHPYGKKAKWALHTLCKGKIVRAEIFDEDDHGRTVAHCFLPDGRDLSAEMVKQGLAIDWPKFSYGKYRAIETPDARKKLFLADARQKGRMHVWEKFEAKKRKR